MQVSSESRDGASPRAALPPGINSEVADGILFVGRVAWLQRRNASENGRRRASASAAVQDAVAMEHPRQELNAILRADVLDAPRLSRAIAAMHAQVG